MLELLFPLKYLEARFPGRKYPRFKASLSVLKTMGTEPQETIRVHEGRGCRTVVAILCGLWIGYASILLNRSLWIDESIAYWVSSGSFATVIHRAIHFQGQSPLYFLIEHAVISVFGKSEIGIRAPSFIFMLISGGVLYRIVKRFYRPEVALLAILCFLSSADGLSLAVTARPYALGVMLAKISIHALLLWIETRGTSHFLLLILSSLLAIYAHYLFAGILVVQAVFFWYLSPNPERKALFLRLFGAWSTVTLCALPGLWQLRSLTQNATLKFGNLTFFDVVLSAIDAPIFVTAIAVSVLHRTKPSTLGEILRKNIFALPLLFWWLFPPLALWFFGELFHPIYQSRYVIWNLPAYSILLALIVSSMGSGIRFFGILLLLQVLQVLQIVNQSAHPSVIVEPWREVSLILHKETKGKDIPVFVHSVLMESLSSSWINGAEKEEYLLSPLIFYPIEARLVPLPWFFDNEAEPYLSTRVLPLLSQHHEAIFITRGGISGVEYLNHWMEAHSIKSVQTRCFSEICIVNGESTTFAKAPIS